MIVLGGECLKKRVVGIASAGLLSLLISTPAFASTTTFTQSVGSGIVGATFEAQGTPPKVTNSAGISWGGNGPVLGDLSSNASLNCGGSVVHNGIGGVNLQQNGHVGIVSPTAFIQQYGLSLYNKIAGGKAFRASNGDVIHSYNQGGCNFTLDQALAPKLQYAYRVYALQAWNVKGKPVSVTSPQDAKGTNSNGWYCPFPYTVKGANRTGIGTVTDFTSSAKKQYYGEGFSFPGVSSGSSKLINFGCAGLYEIQSYRSVIY